MMNWGYKILTVYAIFLSGILFLVFKSSSQNQDLVTADYYEQELKYQERINETVRANALSAEVKYEIRNQEITVSLPPEMNKKNIQAEVLLYCTADKSKDLQKELDTNDGTMHFTIPENNKGLHELQIKWVDNGTGYFYKHKIMIP